MHPHQHMYRVHIATCVLWFMSVLYSQGCQGLLSSCHSCLCRIKLHHSNRRAGKCCCQQQVLPLGKGCQLQDVDVGSGQAVEHDFFQQSACIGSHKYLAYKNLERGVLSQVFLWDHGHYNGLIMLCVYIKTMSLHASVDC